MYVVSHHYDEDLKRANIFLGNIKGDFDSTEGRYKHQCLKPCWALIWNKALAHQLPGGPTQVGGECAGMIKAQGA